MDWRKSSYSGANGGNCVEVTDDARFKNQNLACDGLPEDALPEA